MGTIFWINNALSLKLVQFSPKNFFCGEKSNIWKNHVAYNKQLVEFDGNLCVVDMYIDDERFYKLGHFLKAIRVKVYKLDQEWGKWLYVKDLGDMFRLFWVKTQTLHCWLEIITDVKEIAIWPRLAWGNCKTSPS
ncbi:hypothetical protein MtrunA17_Chr7g0261161 [Medicago truncatula]|uniref:KIB1-4 beta-propeller domain-containing protein n=1 Tax=Medicago truncatula TaxID=3880 RepID=A0A072U476_MEDTR|nr:hypothetical protein MTR_7g096760 [Medicago truncatula]RHN48195.1 hypothetical protein MtrunA17_Chr7g0261161 [Medicago truncatula]